MTTSKLPKKSETIEIRLPHATKSAFMARCREEGRTASDAVRGFIELELDQAARPPAGRLRMPWWKTAVAAMAGLAVGAVAAPSLAHPSTHGAGFGISHFCDR